MGLGIGNIVWISDGAAVAAATTGEIVDFDVSIGQVFCAAVNMTQTLSSDASLRITSAQCSDISATIDTDGTLGRVLNRGTET